jgi:hypothetical protein
MKSLSPNVVANDAQRVAGLVESDGKVSAHAGVFANRGNKELARPAWLEACELARRAGDDLEWLADRLASSTGKA